MKVYDLTRIMANDMPVWPGTPKPSFTKSSLLEKDGFYETRVETFSHVGTHIDAPSHILPGGKTLDEYPANTFWGTAWVLDVSKLGPGGLITPGMLDGFPGADFLLVSTGWELYWNSVSYFQDYPVLTPEAIQRALSLGVRGIGFDSMSPDPVSDRNYTNHKLILGEGALIIENLCGLAPIRGRKTKFTALPLKYLNADGAPCRAVAVED
ncbi:MAG TPA: cyclase family protein [Candidatus Scatomorpha gallistercoris]|nr:cyclase family protein [Candidatus Scatomorpha gallistercoris]